MKLLFALFLLSQVALCKASFDTIREETEAAIVGKALKEALKKDIDLVKDAIANASPGSEHIFSSTNNHGDRQLKKSKNKKSSKKSSKNQYQNVQCEADLAVAQKQIEELSQPTLLGIQTTTTCRVERVRTGEYKLISDNVSADTYIFTDRPSTIEYTVPTEDFIRDFDDIFSDSPPNTGLTFVQDGDPVGPFVVIFDDAKMIGNEVTYDIRQSQSQSGVYSMEELFSESDNSVEFRDCSYFIDNWATKWLTCPLCEAAIPALVELGGPIACDLGCAGILGVACFPIGGFICAVNCLPICAAIFVGGGIAAGAGASSICAAGRLC